VQKIFASILLFAFLGQTFNQGWYYLGYLVQKEEYAKRCVNKSRPQLHCNGKCQMMMKLKAQEEKERGLPPELKLASKIEVISSRSFFLTEWLVSSPIKAITFINYKIGNPIDRSLSFFHPPDAQA
jgi:hypothetical protein